MSQDKDEGWVSGDLMGAGGVGAVPFPCILACSGGSDFELQAISAGAGFGHGSCRARLHDLDLQAVSRSTGGAGVAVVSWEAVLDLDVVVVIGEECWDIKESGLDSHWEFFDVVELCGGPLVGCRRCHLESYLINYNK